MVEQIFSIIIPAKDEAESLSDLLPKLIALKPYEIIVVDDGSADNTREICDRNSVRVISHPYSKGNGAAIKTGLRASSSDTLVFMDADGQHRAEAVLELLQRYKDGYDMVVGARSFDGQANVYRGVANTIYNWLASKMVGRKIYDLTSGMRVISREKMLEFIHLLPNKFSYPTTITMAFFRAGYSVDYVKIIVEKRIGKSHISPVKDGIRFLLIILKVANLYSPLKFFAPVSAVLFLSATAYYLFTYYTGYRFTNMGALLYSTSIVTFLIGLVSEQITALYYQGREK